MLLAANETIELPWIRPQLEDFINAVDSDRAPHAIALYGPQGSGRRQLARMMVEQLLARPLDDNEQHPDYLEIVPEADKPDADMSRSPKPKKSIGVDQVRHAIGFLQLTSHQQGEKVAAVFPADKLTNSAANSFLKTLEEPPDNTLIILVCEKLTSLPATVVSRCQHVRVSPPAADDGVAWLQQFSPETEWGGLLEFCGYAPLYARNLQQSGFIDVARQYAKDLNALQNRSADPVLISKQWAKTDLSLCFRWLYAQAAKIMRQQADGGNANQRTEACYAYLRELNILKQQLNSGLNMDLNLARLLHAWYGGFRGLP